MRDLYDGIPPPRRNVADFTDTGHDVGRYIATFRCAVRDLTRVSDYSKSEAKDKEDATHGVMFWLNPVRCNRNIGRASRFKSRAGFGRDRHWLEVVI
jgi:hypothetical protein